MLHYDKGEALYWDRLHDEIRFSVSDDRRALLCRVQARALEREGARPGDVDSYLAVARRCFVHITRRISDKLALDLIEPDGSVLVRVRDW